MKTRVGTGQGSDRDARSAAGLAATAALTGLNGPPSYGFAFCGPDHDLDVVIRTVQGHCGGIPLVGCSTAGEFTDRGVTHGGVVVMLVQDENAEVATSLADRVSVADGAGAHSIAASAGKMLGSRDRGGHPFLTSVLLIDGLAGTGEDVVSGLCDRVGMSGQVVGGAAGDEGRFKATHVASDRGAAASSGVVVLHVATEKQWGVGVGHGLTPASSKMRVTRASGTTVYEIDERPAIEAYQGFARERGVALTEDNQGAFMVAHELGIYAFGAVRRARAPLSVGPDGSLKLAGTIPQGSKICILDGDPSSLVAAAEAAALEAKERLRGHDAAGVIVFDCICRGMILGDRFGEEIAAIRRVFPDVPVAGFLTYGEIARYGGHLEGWHNTTAVVAAIPA